MLNPINEMRRLSSRSYEDLLRVATANYGFCPNGARVSKIELITYIVTAAAIRDQFADMMIAHPQEKKDNRTPYRITGSDNSEHYLQLTDEQERFLKWNVDHCINYDRSEVEILDDIDWETP